VEQDQDQDQDQDALTPLVDQDQGQPAPGTPLSFDNHAEPASPTEIYFMPLSFV
jgi:hypothetical protein